MSLDINKELPTADTRCRWVSPRTRWCDCIVASVPVNKVVCSSFMMSSVLHQIAVREEVVPVPFRQGSARWGNGLWNRINLSGVERASSSTNATSSQRLVRPGLQHGWGERCDYVRHTTGPLALVHCALEFWVRFPNERSQGKQGATLC
jgi:hypothetical protein